MSSNEFSFNWFVTDEDGKFIDTLVKEAVEILDSKDTNLGKVKYSA